jgi:hypothetical protein
MDDRVTVRITVETTPPVTVTADISHDDLTTLSATDFVQRFMLPAIICIRTQMLEDITAQE